MRAATSVETGGPAGRPISRVEGPAVIEKRSKGLVLRFDVERLAGEVIQEASGFAWTFDLTAAPGVAVGQPDPMWAEYPWAQHSRAMERLRPLRPADVTSSRERPNGVDLDFEVAGARFRVALELGDEADELVFRLQPIPWGRADLVGADLPGPLRPADDAGVQVLLAYRHQGRLYTGRPGPLEHETPDARTLAMPEGRHRLRFFGVLGDVRTPGSAAAGYLAIIEENADAEIVLRQADDGRLACSPTWMPSMGTLAYTRVVRYRFQANPTTTTLAKGFRRYAKAAGLFKSLKDKIAERPIREKMVGTTACFIGYQACKHDYVAAFKRLREMGHKRFYIFPTFHINAHCGAFAGERVIDIRDRHEPLRAVGGLVGSWTYLAGLANESALHRLAARNADGTMPFNWRIADDFWPQACMREAYQWLAGREEDILVADAHHFDTTASNSLMECYSTAHPLDRRGDREHRIKMFQEVSRRGRIVASEGVKDWAVPHYDMGSNKEIPAPSASSAFRAVPLQHLVYHDALFFLWWEVHGYDVPFFGIGGDCARQSLTDLLYGDMPLIFPVGRQYRWADRALGIPEPFEQSLDLPRCIEAARRAVDVAKHFGRVATEDLTDFTWLTDDGAVQQTQFGNGISVIANFGDEPFRTTDGRVVPPLDTVTLDT